MKVLVLSGEVTHQRPLSYGLPADWDVHTLSIVDNEFLALCEKYGDSKSISLPETISSLKRFFDLTVADVQANDYDVLIGIGYGAHVLLNMTTAYEWRGPSVLIFTESLTHVSFTAQPPLDEIEFDTRPFKSIRVTIGEKIKSRGGRRERHESDSDTILQTHIFDKDWEQTLYTSGLLSSLVRAVYRLTD